MPRRRSFPLRLIAAGLLGCSVLSACSKSSGGSEGWPAIVPDARWLQPIPAGAPPGDPLMGEAPEDAFRVVLVGEPFVLGMARDATDRVGDHLIQALARAEELGRPVDVRHLALFGRSLADECGFLESLVSRLDADLIVHHTDPSDLDGPVPGVAKGGATYGVPSVVAWSDPEDPGATVLSHLADGLDWESRSRLEGTRVAVTSLAQAVADAGGRYQLLVNWGERNSIAHSGFVSSLPEDTAIYLDQMGHTDQRLTLGRVRLPWSRQERLRVALLLYSAISRRDLAGEGVVPTWQVADRELLNLHEAGREEALSEAIFLGRRLVQDPPGRVVDLTVGDPEARRQVHGGLAADGGVGPYASLIVAGDGVQGLVLAGQRTATAGAEGRLRVWVDGLLLGTVDAGPEGPFQAEFTIPTELGRRRFLSVRLVSLGPAGGYRLERAEVR